MAFIPARRWQFSDDVEGGDVWRDAQPFAPYNANENLEDDDGPGDAWHPLRPLTSHDVNEHIEDELDDIGRNVRSFAPYDINENLEEDVVGAEPAAVAVNEPPPCPYSDYTVIGQGSYGTVYRVELPDKQVLALKSVRHGAAALVPTEIDIMFRLFHPNLALGMRLIQSSELKPCPGMEQFTLGVLMPLYETKPPREFPLSTFAAQLANGLHYLHISGFLHLDIKLTNTLYNAVERQMMISDFGLSMFIGNELDVNMYASIGTLYYKAPEMLRAPYEASRATDVYSFGVLLYNRLSLTYRALRFKRTRDVPREDEPRVSAEVHSVRMEKLAALAAHLQARSADKTHRLIVSLVQRMMNPDPSRRITLPEVLLLLQRPMVDGASTDLTLSATTAASLSVPGNETLAWVSDLFWTQLELGARHFPTFNLRVAFLGLDLLLRAYEYLLPDVAANPGLYHLAVFYICSMYYAPRGTTRHLGKFLAFTQSTFDVTQFETAITSVLVALGGCIDRPLYCDSATSKDEWNAIIYGTPEIYSNAAMYCTGIRSFARGLMTYVTTFQEQGITARPPVISPTFTPFVLPAPFPVTAPTAPPLTVVAVQEEDEEEDEDD